MNIFTRLLVWLLKPTILISIKKYFFNLIIRTYTISSNLFHHLQNDGLHLKAISFFVTFIYHLPKWHPPSSDKLINIIPDDHLI